MRYTFTMKRIAVLFLLAAGCASASHSTISAPDGRPAILVECTRGISNCYAEANRVCRGPYDVLDRAQGTRVWSYGQDVNSVETGNMLIRCKTPQVARR